MTTALIFIAYVAFGFGFTAELLSDNTAVGKFGVVGRTILVTSIFAIWPLILLLKLGIRAGK